MQVLNDHQIHQKITRLAYQILENHLDDDMVYLAGINKNGYRFAVLLRDELKKISEKKIALFRIRLNPADPLEFEPISEYQLDDLSDKSIIIVDDVANTGRTIFFACVPILKVLPKRVEVAVLVDRKHKQFPVKIDYFGLSLATTIQENIKAKLDVEGEFEITLQ